MTITNRLLTSSALLALAAAAAQAQQPPATGTRPAATAAANPYTRVANPAPAVPNPRDQLPFTNDKLTGLNPALPTLFIAGDSTAATGNATTRGWASCLADYFDTTKVNLVNRGVGGARFNTYMGPTWDAIVAALKPGDFVVIQFGHNSGPLPGIGEETQPAPAGRGNAGGAAPAVMHTHGWYLRKFISDVRAKNATPIAATLTLRDLWKDGKVERLKEQVVGQGAMSDWTRQVATAEKVLLVDHSNIIADIYDKLGTVETDKLFGDHYLHTNTAGAAIKPGDFVVIQFGHNSGPLPGIGEETQGAMHTHGWYLRKFIAGVRAKKATPIAATLTLRDLWKDGKVERLKEQVVGQGAMSDWTRQVAAADKVLLVDHSTIIGDLLDKLGPTEGDKLFGDHYVHTNTAGAIINCEAFISGLKALPDMPLVNCLNDKGQALPTFKPATPSAPAGAPAE